METKDVRVSVVQPRDQLDAGRDFYARLLPDIDDAHFGALWHLFTVGHLVATDLDNVARPIGCSFADLDLLGTLAVFEDGPVRATDLAAKLYVSNAVISTRIARLSADGLVVRERARDDRRAYTLRLTDRGRAMVVEAIGRLSREAKIARFFRQLDGDDQQALIRILSDLHQRFHREFNPSG